MAKPPSKQKSELLSLMNVGPAACQDFLLLGITSLAQLAKANPDELYQRLQKITGTKQDPCVWDVFAATIHEAQTGEKKPWWHWSEVRKKRELADDI